MPENMSDEQFIEIVHAKRNEGWVIAIFKEDDIAELIGCDKTPENLALLKPWLARNSGSIGGAMCDMVYDYARRHDDIEHLVECDEDEEN